MRVLAVLFLLAFAYLGTATDNSDVNRPVNKVIKLLKEMQSQLEQEQKEDEEVYDKLACWCESNDKKKTQEIADAEAHIGKLTAAIEENTATTAKLEAEIEALTKEIADNQNALKKATAIRTKEHNEYMEEAGDMEEAISSLKAAIVVLSKHHAPPAEALMNIGTMLRHQMRVHKDLLADILSHRVKRTLTTFLQGDFFGQAPAFKQAYAPQSGEIFGILQQMQESFEANLGQATKEDNQRQADYDALKSAKEAEIAAGQEQLEAKKAELAQTGEDNAADKQDLEDTQGSLAADQQFLADLKEKCATTDEEWEQRQKDRQSEMGAVSKALAILTSDSAHDLFVRTFNPGFVQAEETKVANRRQAASLILKDAGRAHNNAALLELANQVQLDAFTRVKAAIDDMVAQLLKEQKDEQAHRDWCNTERNTNDQQTASAERTKSDLDAAIEGLTQKIDALTKEIDGLQAEIADAQIEIKRAGEDREAQNRDFQTVVTDQRETQKVLARALQVLQAEYAKALIQLRQGPPPPPGFAKYEKNAGAQGVMDLIENIIGEAKQMEKEAVQAERDAQSAYETFVKDTNAEIADKQRQIVDNTETKAKAEGDKVAAEDDKASTLTELEELSQYSANLHASCDFIVKNFEIRQTARAQEIEALRQAKAILSGAQFSGASLLRRK